MSLLPRQTVCTAQQSSVRVSTAKLARVRYEIIRMYRAWNQSLCTYPVSASAIRSTARCGLTFTSARIMENVTAQRSSQYHSS